jgi:AraC-like DNA-binding protein
VVLHDALEAHRNRFPSAATVLNISLPDKYAFQPGLGRVDDPDALVRIAEKNEAEAAAVLLSVAQTQEPACHDWPEELAAALLQDPSLNLTAWSETNGISPWTLSRGFAQVFGIAASAFRARTRARQAWKAIQTTDTALAAIAAELGFADQSHMTRSVKNITGKGPHAWRSAANRFKTQ